MIGEYAINVSLLAKKLGILTKLQYGLERLQKLTTTITDSCDMLILKFI